MPPRNHSGGAAPSSAPGAHRATSSRAGRRMPEPLQYRDEVKEFLDADVASAKPWVMQGIFSMISYVISQLDDSKESLVFEVDFLVVCSCPEIYPIGP